VGLDRPTRRQTVATETVSDSLPPVVAGSQAMPRPRQAPADEAGSAIRASGLVKWFGEVGARTFAVREVSFEAALGEMLYLVGPSGSGKTTLLSIISGILRPDEGRVHVKGEDIWSLGSDRLADFRLNTVGFVFQDYHLFPRLTTAENVAMPLVLKKWAWKAAIAEAHRYLEIVGLADRAALPPVKLSGGEQQRVAIARAIVAQPDILILDEPTASLDGDTGRRILSFVRSEILTGHRCILIVTHDTRIYEFADRIMRMEDGRITGIERVSP
jgi:putative ABC transport system ATP-binding protein